MRERLRRIKDLAIEHKAAALGIAVALAAVVGLATYVSVEATSTVEFCIQCHEMRPAYESYLASSHYRVEADSRRATCRDCHIPPWTHPVALLWTKAYHGAKDVARHVLDTRELLTADYHEKMKASAPHGIHNASCLKCHRDVFSTVEAGGKETAELHRSLKDHPNSRCSDCHRNMVHYPYRLETTATASP